MSPHASLISPPGPMSVMYPRTLFSDYLGTGPTLRRKCACGAKNKYCSKSEEILPVAKSACLALQVGGNLIPAKNLTKKKPPIFRVLLGIVECISQFFLGLLQCIFHV